MHRIQKTSIPENSLLRFPSKPFDYSDSYSGVIHDPQHQRTSTDLARAFFSSGPKWVDVLFKLRNKAVAILGLKTSNNSVDRTALLANFKCEVGQQFGLFQVFEKNDEEVILGTDDKHLNFRVSLHVANAVHQHNLRVATVSTVVHFNNVFGRLYFLPVRPFHQLIVPAMLKAMLKQLDRQK
ncbi:MAG: DUF2867 domain-containing protein [Chitinophagales bacterium]